MRPLTASLLTLAGGALLLAAAPGLANGPATPPDDDPALRILESTVRYLPWLDLLVFEQRLEGEAGSLRPEPRGAMDGAPVLGYVFPTDLPPTAVGFGEVAGILALAATSHPDFDDTPLWDESMDGRYDNDGGVWHTHWVVLTEDDRVPGGFSVVEIGEEDAPILPPTHPGMPLYLDSPGHAVITQGDALRILVPAYRVKGQRDFRFDALTAYLEVNTSDPQRPTLGVYRVYDVASGDLSLPYEVVTQE